MQKRFSPLVLAIFISLLVVVAGLLHALKQHPPYAPQINTQQQANGAFKGEEHAKPSTVEAAKLDKEHGGKHSEQGENEGTEFWPPFLGLRLKITDSLLAVFTFGLLVFTGLLWRSTHKLWTAGKKQIAVTRDALIGDQRAWITATLEIGPTGLTFGDSYVDVYVLVKITNAGRTAAVNAHTTVKMIGSLVGTAEAVRALAAEHKVSDPFTGRLVAAGEVYKRPWYPSAANTELYQYGRRGGITPVIIGCVTYEILQDKELHQTSFVYSLGRNDGSVYGGPLNSGDGPLTGDELMATVDAGGFAT